MDEDTDEDLGGGGQRDLLEALVGGADEDEACVLFIAEEGGFCEMTAQLAEVFACGKTKREV